MDWLPLWRIDGPPVFWSLLDADGGGAFRLAPGEEHRTRRRYLPRTNILETRFTTADGVATVTDGLLLQDGGQLSWIELARRVRGVRGRVRLRYEVKPRFDLGRADTTWETRGDVPVARSGSMYLALLIWDAGAPTIRENAAVGEIDLREGDEALLVCVGVMDEPLPFPPRHEIETRFERTIGAWRRWIDFHRYEGPYEEAVERSLLALKLLICAPTGAIAAAPTTSLPERIGGDRNYDYRYAWVRDSAFTLDALGHAGYREQVHASLAWLLRTTKETHPMLVPAYTLDGGRVPENESLPVAGYRFSRPASEGNRACTQRQLGSYGDFLETIYLYVQHGNALDAASAERVSELVDYVAKSWTKADAGIWELPQDRQYTVSNINSWAALERALDLERNGHLSGDTQKWRTARDDIRAYVEERCWSERKQSYSFYADTDELDAALLLAAKVGYAKGDDPRMHSTIDAIRRELGAGGPLLYRYSGQERQEGAFLACSFWLVIALARTARKREARRVMDELVALSNDVGLYAEEIDPESHEQLGNFPQGLTHLSLIDAAVSLNPGGGRRGRSAGL